MRWYPEINNRGKYPIPGNRIRSPIPCKSSKYSSFPKSITIHAAENKHTLKSSAYFFLSPLPPTPGHSSYQIQYLFRVRGQPGGQAEKNHPSLSLSHSSLYSSPKLCNVCQAFLLFLPPFFPFIRFQIKTIFCLSLSSNPTSSSLLHLEKTTLLYSSSSPNRSPSLLTLTLFHFKQLPRYKHG